MSSTKDLNVKFRSKEIPDALENPRRGKQEKLLAGICHEDEDLYYSCIIYK